MIDANELELKAVIKQLLSSANISMAKAIEMVNELHPDSQLTVQNISNKLNRGTLRFTEVINIASVCGYKFKFEPTEQPTYNKAMSQLDDSHPDKQFRDECFLGFSSVDSPNFTEGLSIAGLNAQKAAAYLSERLKPGMSIQREIKLHDEAYKKFNVMIMAVPPDSAWEDFPDPEEEEN